MNILQLQDTKKQHILMAVGIITVGLLVGVFVVVKPELNRGERLRSEVAVGREKQLLVSDILRFHRLLRSYEPLLSKSPESDWHMEAVNRMAGEAGLILTSAAPQPVATKDVFQKMSLQIEAIGGYHNLGRFAERLENYRPLIKIDSFKIERQRKEEDQKSLKIVLFVSSYYRTADDVP